MIEPGRCFVIKRVHPKESFVSFLIVMNRKIRKICSDSIHEYVFVNVYEYHHFCTNAQRRFFRYNSDQNQPFPFDFQTQTGANKFKRLSS